METMTRRAVCCPQCGDSTKLERQQGPSGILWRCEVCQGVMMGVAVLRQMCGVHTMKVWQEALSGPLHPGSARCSFCEKFMQRVQVSKEFPELDICKQCQFVWAQQGELAMLRQLPAPAAPTPPPIGDREAALLELDLLNEKAQKQAEAVSEPDAWWKWVLGLMMLPVEMNSPNLQRRPVIVWSLAGITILLMLGVMMSGTRTLWQWGFIPAQPLRSGGLTLFSSLLLHTNPLHLLSNLYFLIVFGRHIEDRLGHAKFLGLFVIAGLGGHLMQWTIRPELTLPAAGSSGAVAGILAVFLCLFPGYRFGVFSTQLARTGWHVYPAALFVLFWFALQILGMVAVTSYHKFPVGYDAHLGGALAGLMLAALWRNRVSR